MSYHFDGICAGEECDNPTEDFDVTIQQALIALLKWVVDHFEKHDRYQ